VFHREPEWLHGEGIGSSRSPLVMLEYALRAIRRVRRLRGMRLGVLYYGDEGRDCSESASTLAAACARAARVFVLCPGSAGDRFITQRRGVRRFDLHAEGAALKPGQATKKPSVIRWLCQRLEECAQLSSRKARVSVSISELRTSAYRNLLPHEVNGSLLLTFADPEAADRLEARIRELLDVDRAGVRWRLDLLANRPPMRRRKRNEELTQSIKDVAEKWDIPYAEDSALLPSVAGLVPDDVPVICGVGPNSIETATAQEAVQRISVIQRTLLLAQVLLAISERAE
jgi:D-alanine-D-alanine ligase